MMRGFQIKVSKMNARVRLVLVMIFGLCIILMAWPLLPESTQNPPKPNKNRQLPIDWSALTLPTELSKVEKQANAPAYSVDKLDPIRQKATMTIFQSESNQNPHPPDTRTHSVRISQIAHPDWVVPEGSVMSAVLLSAINTDLPGQVKAMISRPVRAWQGARILIPSGSEVIGQYQTKSVSGQRRIFIVWHRLLLPNGRSIALQTSVSDALGRGGIAADQINRHFWATFGQASLLSLIGGGLATMHIGSEEDEQKAIQSELGQDFRQTAAQSLSSGMARGPTLSLRQGQLITIIVRQDLSFFTAQS